jgi:hypothetical protein
MPGNKKPRKKHRPAGRASANRIKAFRYNSDADFWLQHAPHQALESLRNGTADADLHNMLVLRVLLGRQIIEDHLVDPDEARQIMAAGVAAVESVAARHDRLGRFGATGEELRKIGDALNLCDDLQQATTRREQESSLKKVLHINGERTEVKSHAVVD